MSTVILRISPRFCRGRLSPSPSDLLVPFSLLSGPFCPQQPSLSVSLLSYISFLFPLVTAGIGVKRKHIKLNLKFCRNSAFGLKLKDTQPEPAGERNLWLLLCSHYTISFGYTSLRRNLAPGFQQYMLKPVCAGIMPALQSLYHILRICYTLRGMRTRCSGILAPFGRQRLGAGIMPALQSLYHAELSGVQKGACGFIIFAVLMPVFLYCRTVCKL